jgi:predicted protein tyrosine phosphatase
MTLFKFQICRADAVTTIIHQAAASDAPIGSVLSIENRDFADAQRRLLAHQPPLSQRAQNNTLFSLGYAPRLQALPGLHNVRQHFLAFDDIENSSDVGPEPHHVRSISLRVKQHLAARPNTTMLFHCVVGVSRSPGAAIIGVVQAEETLYGRRADPFAAVDTVLAHRPQATPNMLMIEYADALFGYRGKLIDVVNHHPKIMANYEARAAEKAALRAQRQALRKPAA